MKVFLYDYGYQDSRWSFEVPAETKEEADAIIKSMPLANYVGELEFKMPTFVKSNWVADLIIWWKSRTQFKKKWK